MQECKVYGDTAASMLYNADAKVSLDVFYSDLLRMVGSSRGWRGTHSPAVAQAQFLTESAAYNLMHQAHMVCFVLCCDCSLYASAVPAILV